MLENFYQNFFKNITTIKDNNKLNRFTYGIK